MQMRAQRGILEPDGFVAKIDSGIKKSMVHGKQAEFTNLY